MKSQYFSLVIITLFIIPYLRYANSQETTNNTQNHTSSAVILSLASTFPTTISSLRIQERMQKYLQAAISKLQAMKSDNNTNQTISSKRIITPPNKYLFEYLRCLQLKSLNSLPSVSACPYEYEDDLHICWRATLNGTTASHVIEYDHGQNYFYDSVRSGIENCTIQRLCQNNGTWADTVSPDIQCKICIGDGRPVKFNSISIMIETMSLTLSLISLTIAILCMLNVKRLHLPRNLLHMHLFVAFICRSIVKLVFIHIIVGGYTRTMITYTQDKCGNIEILTKSSNILHVIGCRLLSSLFWYTDAVSQTFIFCEAIFLFTALTSHLFRDRGCLPFVLWGWLSPLLWLTLWIVSHLITDRIKQRTTCWLEADNTTYFYYFFYVPYAFYLCMNFGIFLYLVRLLYSKYQSNNVQTNRSGNHHLIKSILILIPLFGLHSLLVMWVFYHQNQGHTIWYFISVIFKAIFGDLQGFFTSLIYFYFNTEIRYEVLRQVQRTMLTNDAIGRTSIGDTLSTRLSTFRRSISRYRQSSIPSRFDQHRHNSTRSPISSMKNKTQRTNWWKKSLFLLCPCFIQNLFIKKQRTSTQIVRQQPVAIEEQLLNDSSPAIVPDIHIIENDLANIASPTGRFTKTLIDNDGLSCDTIVVVRNDHEILVESELLTDENDVTYQYSSTVHNDLHIDQTSTIITNPFYQRTRSNSEGFVLKKISLDNFSDSTSLK